MKANKGKKIDDPFTRRSTKPCMKFKAKKPNEDTLDSESKSNIELDTDKVSYFFYNCINNTVILYTILSIIEFYHLEYRWSYEKHVL